MSDAGTARELVVLLVDDQVMVAEAVRRALADQPDIAFHHCADGGEAPAVAARLAPTVILQDLVMPGVDGLTLVRRYRADAATLQIPIVVLSTREDPAVKSEAFAAGANDYLVKLPDRIELIARVRYHSQSARNRQQLIGAIAELEREREEQRRLIAKLDAAQSQLLQAEKLASIGQLAAGVAHEINNPIGFIASNLRTLENYALGLLRLVDAYAAAVDGVLAPAARQPIEAIRREIDADFVKDDLGELISECKVGIERVARIVGDLREFSRVDSSTAWQAADLNACLDNTLNVLAAQLVAKAELNRDYAVLPAVECIPSQLNQVFYNLLTNAAQAITGRGTIRVVTSKAGDEVCVSIADTGCGMPPEIIGRIFDPFFTTRPVGQGTGLGLSVAHNIVTRHGGRIEVDSLPGQGSTFRVLLPLRGAGTAAAAAAE